MPSADSNPFTNPPRLSPSRPRLHNRTLSRSPARQHARDLDPMLRDLSPTTTLRAFSSSANELSSADALAASIRTSSASERALGAKAAQACLDLRTWTLEMESWQWPGTFDFPEPARKRMRMSEASSDEENEYWGSLPARTVQEYEARADEIGQCLDEIDVEELKDFVLNSHYRVDSRPSSRDKRSSLSSTSSINMKHLDDYTALVTATILQALPFLTRLSRLLDIWTIRLIVLRNAPRYIQDLWRAEKTLEDCWSSISTPVNYEAAPTFDRKSMLAMKEKIEAQVGSLGRRLDRFLDDLEGRDDTVPDSWIDEFELLETAYGSWVVQAERRVLELEWLQKRYSIDQRPESAAEQESRSVQVQDRSNEAEIEDPAFDDDAVMRPSMDLGRDTSVSPDHPQLALSIPAVLDASQQKPDVSPLDSAPSSSRGETPISASKEESSAQVAKRRAAFLHDIEINNSLKQSKSPVRPFEHASSAFTKLFKKHQSPEQIRSKRSVSNNVTGRPSGDGFPAVERKVSPSGLPLISTPTVVVPTGDANNIKDAPQVVSQRAVSEPLQPSSQNFAPVSYDVAEKPPPETYKPTGLAELDSPFSSPSKEGFPENWPLNQGSDNPLEHLNEEHEQIEQQAEVSDESDSGPEIYKPSMPIQTDAFDQLFVQSLPQVGEESRQLTDAPNVPLLSNDRTAQRPSSSRVANATYLDMVPARPRTASTSRDPKRNTMHYIPSGSQPVSDTSIGNRDLERSEPVSIQSSSPSELRQAPIGTLLQRSASSPPASPRSVDKSTHEAGAKDDLLSARPHPIKRASITSIEIYSRSEVKSIDVQRSSRHGSVSSKATPPHTPRLSFDQARPMNYKGMVAFPTPPVRRSSASGQATSPAGQEVHAVLQDVIESSPGGGEASQSPAEADTAPLNVAMAKRRGKNLLRKENERPGSPAAYHTSPTKHLDERDTFDRHVSEVLETLPAPIRFKPRAGAETPVPRGGYIAPRPKNTPRVPSRTSNMTIAPAESSPKKSSSASDPEVKLYHLTQAGRDEPIKLFVRLVGEGERVMVRVGGGWADLADYLRQYADHHGSRTVSEGGLEVQALTATHARKVSGPVEPRARTPGPGTPNPGTPLRPGSNDSENGFFERTGTPNGERTYATNGRQTPTSTRVSTPKSSSSSSRPSTANLSRPSSRQGGTEVGLAGLSSGKKGLLPEHKAKWVDSMIERAKKASAEKSKEDNQKYFGELGKAGGTRRVIFRSSPGGSTGGKK